MKRWVMLAALVVALSSAATVAVQYLPEVESAGVKTSFPVAKGGKERWDQPKAVVEGNRVFEFGTMPQQTMGKHSWVVRNEGKGTLELWMVSSTCSCTLAKFKDGEKAYVKPGDTTEITLEFETRDNNGGYEKGAEIGTNDPSLPQFPLHVRGKVYPALLTIPALENNTINLLSISNDTEDHVSKIGVFSKDRPETKIVKVSSSNPKQIVTSWEPVKPEDLKTLKLERAERLTINVKSPGLPLGNFREEVVVTTDHPKQPALKLTVVGKMEGPVNFGSPGRLLQHFPPVNGRSGGTGELGITVRENRETRFAVVKAPRGLKAEVVPAGPRLKGRYRLIFTIPAGTPAQEIESEIELKTDHPRAERVFVPVSIWIANP